MKRLFWLLLLACSLSLTVFAQTTPDPRDVDLFASFDRDIHRVLDPLAPVLISYVLGPLNKIAVVLFVCILASIGLQAATGYGSLNVEYIVRAFYLPYGFALLVLHNWNTPIPGLGHSFTGVFTDAAQEIAAYIDLSAMQILFSRCADIQDALGTSPSIFDSQFLTYWAMMGFLIMTKGAVFIVVSSAYVALAVGAVLGVLAVFFLVISPLRHLWYGWLGGMIKYCYYFIVAAIVTDIWCLYLVDVMDTTLQGQYDLDHFWAMILSIPVVMVAFVIGVFRVPALAHDFTSGSAGAGHGVTGSLVGFVRGVFS
jgi:hypothetical protein